MAEQSFPFENIDTTEAQFSEWATNFQETGVQGSPTGTELGITVTGSDLNLTVAAGQAFIRGHYYINTSDLVIAVPTAGVNTRIDIVVVELNPETNTIVTKLVQGEAVSADPVAPTLTQSPTGIYQLPIATLTIPTSTVVITAGMLADTRTFMGRRFGIWTTATRPSSPLENQTIGYNTTEDRNEVWNGSSWVLFGAAPSGNYYNITAAGTYTVDLEAGLYSYVSTAPVTVGGVSLSGNGLVNYASAITSLIATKEYNLDTWETQTSGFGTTTIWEVTYGDGLYVAVGNSGTLTTSPDGTTWTTRTSGFGTSTIWGVNYGDGLYVAVGLSGKLTTSPDGTTWTTRTSGFGTSTIWGVAYGDGLYVAVGDSGKLTTSTDGTTWTTRTSGFGTTRIRGVTYGDGLYVAVGDSGKLTTSTDGTTWTTRTSGFGTTTIRGVTYGDGLYVAVGNDGKLTTSTDGTTWTTRTSEFGTTDIYGVTYGDGLYVAVGSSGKMTTSTDGTTWTTRTSGFGTTSIWGVTYGDGLYVAVGSSGTMTTPTEIALNTYLSIELKSPVISFPA